MPTAMKIIFLLPPLLATAAGAGGVGPAGAGAAGSTAGPGSGAGLGGSAGAGGVWVGGVSVVGFISLPQLYDYILARNPKAYKSECYYTLDGPSYYFLC